MAKRSQKKANRPIAPVPDRSVAGSAGVAPRREWAWGLLLVALTVLAYLPVWPAGFIWDDDAILTANPLVQTWSGFLPLWLNDYTPDYYPVTSTMLLLEWHLWGSHPLGYHLVNVLLHAGSALLWWRIFLRMKFPAAWLAAAIFALHPVNVESVAWVAECKNTLSMFFYAGTLWSYLRFEDSENPGWYSAAIGLFGLALLSKTAAVGLPVVLLLLAWWKRGHLLSLDVRRAAPFFGIAIVLAFVTIWFQSHRAIAHAVIRTDSFWSRLAGAGCAVWFYLYKAILPINLIFVYPRWQVDAGSIRSYTPLLLLVAVAVWFWRARGTWGKPWLFGLGYFIVMLLPILGFINVYFMRYSLVADHWQYFAIIAPIALAAAGIHALLGANTQARGIGHGALLLLLGAATWNQCRMYESNEKLWRATREKNPSSAIAWNNLAEIDADAGRVDEAMAGFQKALEIDPENAEAHNNLGIAFTREQQYPQAIEQYQAALSLKPDYMEAQNNLGNALVKLGRIDDAIPYYRAALKINPYYAGAHYDLGLAFARQGRMQEASNELQIAVQLKPDNPEAHLNLANALLGEHRIAEAIPQYETALALKPDDLETLNNLALILATAANSSFRDGNRAVRLAEHAEQLDGGKSVDLLVTLAAAYAEAGRFPEAIAVAQRGLQFTEAHRNTSLAETFRSRLKLYQSGQADHGFE